MCNSRILYQDSAPVGIQRQAQCAVLGGAIVLMVEQVGVGSLLISWQFEAQLNWLVSGVDSHQCGLVAACP